MTEDFPLTFETALKAMLDGLIVMDSKHTTPSRFDKKSQTFQYYKDYHWHNWTIKPIDRTKTHWCVIEFTEEYPLSFDEALRLMLDGKYVMCVDCPNQVFRYTTTFEREYVNGWDTAPITYNMQANSKWKVVE